MDLLKNGHDIYIKAMHVPPAYVRQPKIKRKSNDSHKFRTAIKQ